MFNIMFGLLQIKCESIGNGIDSGKHELFKTYAKGGYPYGYMLYSFDAYAENKRIDNK